MPRRPRLVLPGVPLHVIQRGNNRQACFFADEDYQLYLALGSPRFQEEVAAMLKRRVTPGKSGRPRKQRNRGNGWQ